MFDVFLDRDGVINAERADYVKSWDEFRFLPGALDGIRLLTEAGCRLFVVTNQAGVNRGIIPAERLLRMHERLRAEAAAHGGRIEGVFFCPHRPDEDCDCRKPRSGLFLLANDVFEVDFSHAYVVGDNLSDIEAGQAVGCRPILVRSGRRPVDPCADLSAHPGLVVAADLWEAAHRIVGLPAPTPGAGDSTRA